MRLTVKRFLNYDKQGSIGKFTPYYAPIE